jgi:hypothetical protein
MGLEPHCRCVDFSASIDVDVVVVVDCFDRWLERFLLKLVLLEDTCDGTNHTLFVFLSCDGDGENDDDDDDDGYSKLTKAEVSTILHPNNDIQDVTIHPDNTIRLRLLLLFLYDLSISLFWLQNTISCATQYYLGCK